MFSLNSGFCNAFVIIVVNDVSITGKPRSTVKWGIESNENNK